MEETGVPGGNHCQAGEGTDLLEASLPGGVGGPVASRHPHTPPLIHGNPGMLEDVEERLSPDEDGYFGSHFPQRVLQPGRRRTGRRLGGLLESDAPHLVPATAPWKAKTHSLNPPWAILEIAEEVARIRGVTVHEVPYHTHLNQSILAD